MCVCVSRGMRKGAQLGDIHAHTMRYTVEEQEGEKKKHMRSVYYLHNMCYRHGRWTTKGPISTGWPTCAAPCQLTLEPHTRPIHVYCIHHITSHCIDCVNVDPGAPTGNPGNSRD